ncbi:MAG: amino acid racemase [Oscillospiraceae bacterium]|nr:amino acid racemase [Oscillospiraceae bacterium]MDE7172070.1 amino acid racemase [Oscillospiraceae bacterium]
MKYETKLGVLGGMGPQATQVFYQFVLDRTDAAKDQDHLPAVILSDTGIPDRTAAILSGNTEELYQRLLGDAKTLEACGCTVLAIPCNTSHYFADRLQGDIGVPIIHMLREAAAALAAQGKKRPGILATDGTIQTGLYQKECANLGMEAVAPDPDTQKLVMSIIYDEIKQGEKGSREKFAHIDRAIRRSGCDCAILACTELSVFATYHPLPSFYLDAMMVMAERAVERCGYPLRTI